MTSTLSAISLRTMRRDDWDDVASLIHTSLNAWYLKNRGFELVAAPWETMRIFPRVYTALDGEDCCLVAIDGTSGGRLVGQCFYHPRSTHIAIGIVTVHPDAYGQGVARQMMREVIAVAEAALLPLRLVSSAMNLDSFTLYNKLGFRPLQFFQDMIWDVPQTGVSPFESTSLRSAVRTATLSDLDAIAMFERRQTGLDRARDISFFLDNAERIWGMSVSQSSSGAGEIDGWLASVRDPGSTMLGPGTAIDELVAASLVHHRLDALRGSRVVWLVRSDCPQLTAAMYALGARNCETHITQVRPAKPGDTIALPSGIIFPTFMPETA